MRPRQTPLACLVLLLAATATAFAQPTAPSPNGRLMLFRNTIAALNHATITGNYTVLRDLGSQEFQARHKAADLATLFAALREQKVDLSATLIREPLLAETPVIDAGGRLRLVGRCPTTPRALAFELRFAHERGGWTIDEIGLAFIDPNSGPVASPNPIAQAPRMVHQDQAVRPASLQMPAQMPVRRLPPSDGH